MKVMFLDESGDHSLVKIDSSYPMFVLAAHTGARRSELIRARLVDFGDDIVVIRERKRAKGKHTTRQVPLSSLGKRAMAEWFSIHPGGEHAFCQSCSKLPGASGGPPRRRSADG